MMESATGKEEFVCKEPGCTKSYTTKSGLRYHNKAVHNKLTLAEGGSGAQAGAKGTLVCCSSVVFLEDG